jgi:hypothetical protein
VQTTASNPNVTTTLSATATCPAGKVLLGGGAKVTSGQPERAVVQQSYPSAANTWTAVGLVITSMNSGNTMSVQAFVVCTS